MNVQLWVTSGVPVADDRIAVGLPTTLTRYTVFLASAALGLSTARVAVGAVTAAGTTAFVAALVRTTLALPTPMTAWLKFAAMFEPRATLTALATGVVVVTVGATGATVVKLQLVGASGTPPELRGTVSPLGANETV